MTRFCLKPLTLTTWIALGVISQINTAQAADDFLIANTNNQTLIQTQDARNQALLEQLVPNPSVVVDAVGSGIDAGVGVADTTTQIQEQPVAKNNQHQITPFVLIFIRWVIRCYPKMIIFANKLGFALMPEIMGNHSVLGKCMTVADIHAIATRVQNRLIDKGYITSRIMVSDQNLADGKLRLTLIPGKIAQVVVNTVDIKAPIYVKRTNMAYPAILDTALENFKRVPSSDASFKIAPSDELQAIGISFSDILIDYTQHRRLRGSLSMDDSGSKSTGKYQSVATLSVDNLANYKDLLYLSFGRDLGNQLNEDKDYPSNMSKGSKNYGIGYVIPIKSSLLQLNANRHTYHQTVAGSTQDYVYGGKSSGYNAKLSHLIHRDTHSKSHVYAGGHIKSQEVILMVPPSMYKPVKLQVIYLALAMRPLLVNKLIIAQTPIFLISMVQRLLMPYFHQKSCLMKAQQEWGFIN